MIKKCCKHWLPLAFLFTWFSVIGGQAYAQQNPPSQDNVAHFDTHSVYYSIFPSTFIQPNVASAYGIKRSRYELLINISVSERGQYGGVPVTLSGYTKNLMQQQKPLNFITIQEEGATYYLAPLRITGEEVRHFELRVTPEGQNAPLNVEFSKHLYPE